MSKDIVIKARMNSYETFKEEAKRKIKELREKIEECAKKKKELENKIVDIKNKEKLGTILESEKNEEVKSLEEAMKLKSEIKTYTDELKRIKQSLNEERLKVDKEIEKQTEGNKELDLYINYTKANVFNDNIDKATEKKKDIEKKQNMSANIQKLINGNPNLKAECEAYLTYSRNTKELEKRKEEFFEKDLVTPKKGIDPDKIKEFKNKLSFEQKSLKNSKFRIDGIVKLDGLDPNKIIDLLDRLEIISDKKGKVNLEASFKKRNEEYQQEIEKAEEEININEILLNRTVDYVRDKYNVDFNFTRKTSYVENSTRTKKKDIKLKKLQDDYEKAKEDAKKIDNIDFDEWLKNQSDYTDLTTLLSELEIEKNNLPVPKGGPNKWFKWGKKAKAIKNKEKSIRETKKEIEDIKKSLKKKFEDENKKKKQEAKTKETEAKTKLDEAKDKASKKPTYDRVYDENDYDLYLDKDYKVYIENMAKQEVDVFKKRKETEGPEL